MEFQLAACKFQLLIANIAWFFSSGKREKCKKNEDNKLSMELASISTPLKLSTFNDTSLEQIFYWTCA